MYAKFLKVLGWVSGALVIGSLLPVIGLLVFAIVRGLVLYGPSSMIPDNPGNSLPLEYAWPIPLSSALLVLGILSHKIHTRLSYPTR